MPWLCCVLRMFCARGDAVEVARRIDFEAVDPGLQELR